MTAPTEAGGLTPEECPAADVAEFEQEFAAPRARRRS